MSVASYLKIPYWKATYSKVPTQINKGIIRKKVLKITKVEYAIVM